MPRSSKLIAEDGDYSLYSVVLFRRVADSFKANARTRGFQVYLRSSVGPPMSWLHSKELQVLRPYMHRQFITRGNLHLAPRHGHCVILGYLLRMVNPPNRAFLPQRCWNYPLQVREHELDEEKAEADVNNSNALAGELAERKRTLEQWSVAAYGEVHVLRDSHMAPT